MEVRETKASTLSVFCRSPIVEYSRDQANDSPVSFQWMSSGRG